MTQPKATPPQPNEFQLRVDAFLKDYQDLTKKHEIDFANYPMYIPDEKGGFRVVVQSTPVDLRLQELNKSFVAK